MPTLTIDGKDYDTDKLSKEAKEHYEAIQFTQVEMARLQRQLAVLQTARTAYGIALKELIEKGESNSKPSDNKEMPASISFD